MLKITSEEHEATIERCLRSYLRAGTSEMSLDDLGVEVGVTKRMLLHYFGSRQGIEARAIALFEKSLEDRLQPDRLPSADTFQQAVLMLWDQLTAAEFHDSLRLTYDLFRFALKSDRARAFHDRQLQLWTEVLLRHTDEPAKVNELATALKSFAWASLSGQYAGQCRTMLERLASS